jgi:hypothetical protein
MSKRHQASRRRAYGRRQHEVHERHRPEATGAESADVQADPLSFLDPRSPRLRFGFAD